MALGKVELLPHRIEDASQLAQWVDADLLKYFLGKVPQTTDVAEMESYIALHLTRPVIPFTIWYHNQAIGSSSYLDIRLDQGGVEVGYTWIARPFHQSVVNPTIKLLMLQKAFEEVGLQRVALKCDAQNIPSATAIQKLGAKSEGIFRRHRITGTGESGDTHMFSLIAEEWPEAKERLLRRIADFTQG